MTKNHPASRTDRIYLTGFMGSGKSVVGRILAGRLHREFADLDDVIARATGMSIPEIFREKGERAFREMERNVAARYAGGRRVVALGGGTIMDPATRDLLAGSGVLVYLRASLGTLAERLRKERGHRPMLEGETPVEERIAYLMRERVPVYETAEWIVDTDKRSAEEVACHLYMRIREKYDD